MFKARFIGKRGKRGIFQNYINHALLNGLFITRQMFYPIRKIFLPFGNQMKENITAHQNKRINFACNNMYIGFKQFKGFFYFPMLYTTLRRGDIKIDG